MKSGRFAWPTAPLALLVCAATVCGCGNPGPPLPPSLMLPQPVGDLRAQRIAGGVLLQWTMPTRSTDRVALKGGQRAVVCRAEGEGACATVATLLLAPGAPAAFEDALPAPLHTGPLRTLRYEVKLENRRGMAAGASNAAPAAGGPAPPALRDASAANTAKGIVVHWNTVPATEPGEKLLVRLTREQVERTGVPPVPPQTLEAAERWEAEGKRWAPDHTLDTSTPAGGAFRYRVELVSEITAAKQPLEIAGANAETPKVEATDVFPPAAPEGLEAVANAEGGSIDLSWNAGSEPDLAGYFVYRRTSGAAGVPERVSGKTPVRAPGWSDSSAKPGVRYAYSVSAVDASGNESARSRETVESLPASKDQR